MFALFKDGKQISKAHRSKRAALIEAYEAKAVVSSGVPDFEDDDAPSAGLADGYEIRKSD